MSAGAPAAGEPPNFNRKFEFIKFHQVGGTSVAETMYKFIDRHELRGCCIGTKSERAACQICADHNSLACLVDEGRHCLALPGAFSPKPATATLLREPLDKALAKYYFIASRNDIYSEARGYRQTVEDWASKHIDNEYLDVLGGMSK